MNSLSFVPFFTSSGKVRQMRALNHKHTIAGIFATFLLTSSGSLFHARGDILVSKHIDYSRLAGTWYEIARLPNKREEGLVNITTTFNLVGSDKIEIVNRGYQGSGRGKPVTFRLTARLPDPHEPASLTVRYCGIFRFTYNVLELDTAGYQYAMVSGDSRNDLWLFSRTPVMDEDVYERLVNSAKADGYDVSKLIRCPQEHPSLAAKARTGSSSAAF
ncbi:MAG: hypothetical protein GF344_10340 [Chitinivibrionales bacterium]|nr:hypothetical protein [Chitinivibrionales bacterium]MBD3357227.1 hypothetical protein [Chitinivibrionales bacterium]